MRIGMFLEWYPDPNGITTAVRGLAQALSRLGVEVTILSQSSETSEFREMDVTVQTFKRPALHRFGMPSSHLRSVLEHNTGKFDLLILNTIFARWLPALARSARRGGIPVIFAPHDPYHDDLFRTKRRRKQVYWALVERPLLRVVDGVQVLAESHRALLRSRGIETPVLVVPNGVDINQGSRVMARRRDDDVAITLGHLGRIVSWHKGLDILVEGFVLALTDHPHLQLEIGGLGGDDAESIKQLIRDRGVEDSVRFRGRIDGSPVDVIGRWDALVVASRFDGFPQTALEAMLAERPILCSREAGVWEYIHEAECGVAIDPTAEGIRLGILELVACRSEWTDMGKRGRQYVEHHLTWDHVAASALSQYQAITDLEPSRAPTLPMIRRVS